MDRVTTYVGAIPAAKDVLKTGQFGMIGHAKLAAGVLGTSAVVSGFTCTPNTPAALNVILTPGEIYQLANLEATSWSALPSDTRSIVKQGILIDPVTLTITPPGTVGYSQVFLIEVQYQDSDTSTQVLNYYNATNPNNPYYGPPVGGTGSGAAQSTVRAGNAAYQVKAGVAAPTGTQIAPTQDAGWIGLFLVTVANGATTITSGNIAQVTGAPFIPVTLPKVPDGVQKNLWTFANDTGTANALAIALSPPPTTIQAGFGCLIKRNVSNTGASTLSPNGLGPYPIVPWDGQPLSGGEMLAGGVSFHVFDGTSFRLMNPTQPRILTAPRTYFVNSTTGSNSNDGLTSGTPFLTVQKALDTAVMFNLNGFSVTINLATGTYAPFTCNAVNGSGFIAIVGNETDPSLVNINAATGEAINITAPGYFIKGVSVASAASGTLPHVGAGIRVGNGSSVGLRNIILNACFDIAMMVQDASVIALSGIAVGDPTGFVSIGGDSPTIFYSIGGSVLSFGSTILNTLGNRTWSVSFAFAADVASIRGSFQTKNLGGTTTGKRYNVATNAIINTSTADTNYFPGTIAGTTSTGGQYN